MTYAKEEENYLIAAPLRMGTCGEGGGRCKNKFIIMAFTFAFLQLCINIDSHLVAFYYII